MSRLLVIDDEAHRTLSYRDNLNREDFAIVFCSTLDEAHEVLWNPDEKFDAVLQDLQMGRPLPTDNLKMSNAEWERYSGLAGLWFLVNHRELLLSRKIPVVLLTQRTRDEFTDIVNKELIDAGVLVKVLRKVETPAVRLPSILAQFLRECV